MAKRYRLSALMAAAGFLVFAMVSGFWAASAPGFAPSLAEGWVSVGLALALAALTVEDVQRFRLPDLLTLPLIVAGLAVAAFAPAPFLLTSALGAAVGYGLFWVVSAFYRRARGVDGLGLGDAKLLAAGGAWAGLAGLPLILLIASAAGLIWATGLAALGRVPAREMGKARLPFGPFLALGIWCAWLLPDTLV